MIQNEVVMVWLKNFLLMSLYFYQNVWDIKLSEDKVKQQGIFNCHGKKPEQYYTSTNKDGSVETTVPIW